MHSYTEIQKTELVFLLLILVPFKNLILQIQPEIGCTESASTNELHECADHQVPTFLSVGQVQTKW